MTVRADGIGLFSAVQTERRRSISQATTYINDWLIYSQLLPLPGSVLERCGGFLEWPPLQSAKEVR